LDCYWHEHCAEHCSLLLVSRRGPVPEFQSTERWVKCSNYLFKVKIAHSLGIGMISINMIYSLMAGVIMDRSEKGEIFQQSLPTEKEL
jgi:hypothetical protein